MTKKSRKAKAKSRSAGDYQRKVSVKSPVAAGTKPTTKSMVTPSDTPLIAVSQKNQYQYIMPELRRIAIITVGLIVILIILTFVLG